MPNRNTWPIIHDLLSSCTARWQEPEKDDRRKKNLQGMTFKWMPPKIHILSYVPLSIVYSTSQESNISLSPAIKAWAYRGHFAFKLSQRLLWVEVWEQSLRHDLLFVDSMHALVKTMHVLSGLAPVSIAWNQSWKFLIQCKRWRMNREACPRLNTS